jgi:hypothetical protein
MDLHRWNAHLKHPAPIRNGLWTQVDDRKPERFERGEQACRIVECRSNEDVEITVKRDAP